MSQISSRRFVHALPLVLGSLVGSYGVTASAQAAMRAHEVPPTGTEARPSDAQIAAITTAANQGEIQQGQLALERAQNAEVRAFAQMMVQQHTNAQRESDQMSLRLRVTPIPSATSSMLMRDGEQILRDLQARSGPAFDRAYVAAQIREHRDLLRMLDTKLIPSAQNPELRNQLVQLRSAVAMHQTHGIRLEQHLLHPRR